MNRTERRRAMKEKDPYQRVRNAFKYINGEVGKFVYDIIKDSCQNPDIMSFRLEAQEKCYMLYICNGETKHTACKVWALNQFLQLCSEKRLEFEMNYVMKRLIAITADKKNNDDVTYI